MLRKFRLRQKNSFLIKRNVYPKTVSLVNEFDIEEKWSESCGQQINLNNILLETVKEYWQKLVYLPFLGIAFTEINKPRSGKKREHITNCACSFSSMIKIRQMIPTNVWRRNRIRLCHRQHTSMVN